MAINTGKVVVGGLVAGVVLAVLDMVTNGLIFAEQNTAALNALNPDLAANVQGAGSMVAFVAMDLLFGILLVWTYAAMRPRFGAGAKTAMIAGLQIWLVGLLLYVGMTSMGMWTWGYMITGAFVFLVSMLIAAYVGGMLYKEE
jgi:hypothetical protein